MLQIKIFLQGFLQLQERFRRITANQTMRRQDDDVFVVHVGEVGHDVVERLAAAPLGALAAHLVTVIQSRFVAMMAVGDQQGLIFHFLLQPMDQGGIRNAPEAAFAAAVLLDFDEWSRTFDVLRQRAIDRLLRLSVKRKNGTQLGVTGEHEPQPVFLRRVERFLVRPDRPAGELLELRERKKALTLFFFPPFQGEALAQKINRRSFISLEDPVGLPIGKQLRHGVVGIGLLAEIQTDKIVGRPAVELFLLFLRDHVVRRRDDFGQVPEFFSVVENPTKTSDAYHGSLFPLCNRRWHLADSIS